MMTRLYCFAMLAAGVFGCSTTPEHNDGDEASPSIDAAVAPLVDGAEPAEPDGSRDTADGATLPANSMSISAWVTCDGKTDDALGVAKAFAAAANNAFTLVVDCPVFMHVGSDITRPVFIDDGTSVTFTGAGKLIVDNVLVPAFAIMNSSNITLTDWNILYEGIMPIAAPAGTGPGGQWNDMTATAWLKAKRGVSGAKSGWQGLVNTSALFFILGPSTKVTIRGMTATAYSVTEGDRFIPCVVAVGANWKSNQTVSTATATNIAGPSQLTFDHITLDGTIMGWVGSAVSSSTFSNITSKHYADLQDANGQSSGGVGKWFAPPHLFYINEYALVGNNTNLTFTNIVDAPTPISATSNGDRVGTARDATVEDSGVIYSLKLACSNCTVNGYTSNRPDGLMDSLQLDNTTIENVTATYNSVFTNGIYPGVRFPAPYVNLTWNHVSITDVATTPVNIPIGSSVTTSGLLFSDVSCFLNELPKSGVAWASNGAQLASSLRTYHIANPAQTIEVGPNGP